MLKNTIFRSIPLKTLSSTFLVNKTDYLYQQTRSTFILKRRNEPRLHKKYEKRAKLKGGNYLYDLVENTEIKPQKLIKLILTSDVESFGNTGEIVSVKSQAAYNKLILPKLAVYATPENIEKYHVQEALVPRYSSPTVKQLLKMLTTWNIPIIMSNEVPWTLEKWHMRVAFRRAHFHVPEEVITMPEKSISGPDMSLDGKYFFVIVKINNCEEVKVKCTIYHWTCTLKIKSKQELVEGSGEPIFEEDKIVLDSSTTFNSTSTTSV